MGDIQQWVRKTIQPARTRTPTLPPLAEDPRSIVSTGSTSASSTPQKRPVPRKKISSYFSHRSTKTFLDDQPADVWGPAPPGSNDFSPIGMDTMVDSIFSRLCNRPFEGIPAQMNSLVLQIIEAYRKVNMGNEELEERVQEISGRLDEAESKWEQEEACFRAEIKRLELIIAKGKNGMSKLMASRQDSMVNRKGSSRSRPAPRDQTVNEFLLETKRQDDTRKDRKVPPLPFMSPSSKEIALSRQLYSAIHQDIPVGTPPQSNISNTLQSVSMFPTGPYDFLLQSGSVFGDNVTAFSSSGDNLPDELDELEVSLMDDTAKELQGIKVIASAIAENRGLKMDDILPRLIALFDSAEEQPERVLNESRGQTSAPTYQDRHNLHGRRPPSWVPGDDAAGWEESSSGVTSTSWPLLRTIDSFVPARRGPPSDLSVSSSEGSAAGCSAFKPSKIPSPTHEPGLAQSRQELRANLGTSISRPDRDMVSSSTSSRKTAFRNSSELAATSTKSLGSRPQMANGRSAASAWRCGATSSPGVSTPWPASPGGGSPPATGRTSGQGMVKAMTNGQDDKAASIAAAKAAAGMESKVSRTEVGRDGVGKPSMGKWQMREPRVGWAEAEDA